MQFMKLNSLQNVCRQKLLLPVLKPLFYQTAQLLHFTKFIQPITEFESERGRAIVRLIRLGIFCPSSHAYCKLLSECSKIKSLGQGKQIHAQVIRSGFSEDLKIHNHLINLYSICRVFQSARNLFDEVPQRDFTSWFALISEYSQSGFEEEAIMLFDQMLLSGWKCTELIFPSVIKACSITKNLSKGKQIHGIVIATGFEFDVFVANSLVFMYESCGVFIDSRKLFNEMPEKSVASWNALLSSYAWNGRGKKALDLFQEMVRSGIKPDERCLWSIVHASTGCGNYIQGRRAHGFLIKLGYDSDSQLVNALVHLYKSAGEAAMVVSLKKRSM